MVDNLIHKTLAWEDEKKMLFLYDGVGVLFLLSLSLSTRAHVHIRWLYYKYKSVLLFSAG